MDFNVFMNETKQMSRWDVFKIAIFGAFCGALLAISFTILGFY